MPKRSSVLFWAVVAVLFCFAWPLHSSAQSNDPCKNEDAQKAWDSGTDPAYKDATELDRILAARGFVVECVRSSLEQAMVKGQEGGAWFKTSRGVFSAWFLPKGQNFDALEMTEEQQNGRYLYSSRGAQKSLTIDGSKRSWFIKYENVLFHVWGDQQLAESLEKAFQRP